MNAAPMTEPLSTEGLADALAPLHESQEDVIQRLAPTCTCPDDLCLGETGECGPCGEIDPEWDCLRVLARLGTAEGESR